MCGFWPGVTVKIKTLHNFNLFSFLIYFVLQKRPMNTAKNIMGRNKGNEISCEIPLFWKKQTRVDGRENHILEWKYFFLCLSGPSILVFFFYSKKNLILYWKHNKSKKISILLFFRYIRSIFLIDIFQMVSVVFHVFPCKLL